MASGQAVVIITRGVKRMRDWMASMVDRMLKVFGK